MCFGRFWLDTFLSLEHSLHILGTSTRRNTSSENDSPRLSFPPKRFPRIKRLHFNEIRLIFPSWRILWVTNGGTLSSILRAEGFLLFFLKLFYAVLHV